MTDNWARGEYLKWTARKNQAVALTSHGTLNHHHSFGAQMSTLDHPQRKHKLTAFSMYTTEPTDSVLKAVNLAELDYKAVADESFQRVLDIAHNEQGWRVVQQPQLSGGAAAESKHASAISLPSLATVQPELAEELSSNVRINYKCDNKRDLVSFRSLTYLLSCHVLTHIV